MISKSSRTTDGSQYLVRSEGKLYKFSADGFEYRQHGQDRHSER